MDDVDGIEEVVINIANENLEGNSNSNSNVSSSSNSVNKRRKQKVKVAAGCDGMGYW
mgnify:CR=1 FL=1